jgi:hypothetical protein
MREACARKVACQVQPSERQRRVFVRQQGPAQHVRPAQGAGGIWKGGHQVAAGHPGELALVQQRGACPVARRDEMDTAGLLAKRRVAEPLEQPDAEPQASLDGRERQDSPSARESEVLLSPGPRRALRLRPRQRLLQQVPLKAWHQPEDEPPPVQLRCRGTQASVQAQRRDAVLYPAERFQEWQVRERLARRVSLPMEAVQKQVSVLRAWLSPPLLWHPSPLRWPLRPPRAPRNASAQVRRGRGRASSSASSCP